jgi:hypothetical protein
LFGRDVVDVAEVDQRDVPAGATHRGCRQRPALLGSTDVSGLAFGCEAGEMLSRPKDAA